MPMRCTENALKVSLRQHFKHGRAEPASEDVLLDRNDAASLSRRIKQQFQVERLHEERIDDAAVDTEVGKFLGRVKGRSRGLAQGEYDDISAIPQNMALAERQFSEFFV